MLLSMVEQRVLGPIKNLTLKAFTWASLLKIPATLIGADSSQLVGKAKAVPWHGTMTSI